MANIVLNGNWQNVASHQISLSSGFKCTFYIDAYIGDQDTTNNKTPVYTRLTSVVNSGSCAGSGFKFELTGATAYEGGSVWTFENETILSGGFWQNHNDDGTAEIGLSAHVYNKYHGIDFWFSTSGSGNRIFLPTINRYAVTNSVTGDNIEDIFKVNYTKYVSSYKYKLRISIPSVVMLERIDYNTSDTEISLSQTSVDALFARYPNTDEFNLGFAIETWSNDGSTKLSDGNEKTIKCHIYDCNPEFDDFDYEEIETTALTGSTGKFISGYSDVKITVSNGNKAIAQKGASITNYKTFIGSSSKKFDNTIQYPLNYTVENVDSPIVITYAMDSRGKTTPVTRQAELINYTPISYSYFELIRTSNISEETTMKFTGKIDLVDFGLVTNAIKYIRYYYKKVGQPDSAYVLGGTTLIPTVDANGNISINQIIEGDEIGQGFNQNYAYNVKLEIVDELLNVYNDNFHCIETLGSGSPAKAVCGNSIALGMPYDETQGGRVQLSEDTFVKQGNGYKRIPIPVELWSRSKGSFSAQTVSIDLSEYDIFIIEFNLYTGLDHSCTHVVITKDTPLQCSDRFRYNNTYYSGCREYKVTDSGVVFGNAINESGNQDNNWYNPIKIIAMKVS